MAQAGAGSGAGSGAAAAASSSSSSGGGGGGGGDLFGDDIFKLATSTGGARAFRIRNLDDGTTFHVKNTDMYLDAGKLTTFGDSDDDGGDGSGAGDGAEATDKGKRTSTTTTASSSDRPKRHNVMVLVANTERRRDFEGREFTAYVIDVNNIDKQERWTVRRRFRDFVELDKLIRDSPFRTLLTTPLPKKKWFGSMTADVIRDRQRDLQAYLDSCLASLPVHECTALNTFLELNIKRTKSGFAKANPLALLPASSMTGMLTLAQAIQKYPALVANASSKGGRKAPPPPAPSTKG